MATTAQQRAAMEAGDMDDLLPNSRQGPTSVSVGGGGSPGVTDSVSKFAHGVLSCVATVYAFTMYHFLHHKTEFALASILVVCTFIAVVDIAEHQRAKRAIYHPKMQHDWTHITSAMDLKLGKVDHWCLGGGDAACGCEDPLVPSQRSEARGWGSAHHQNVEAIRGALAREAEAYEEDEEEPVSGNEGSDANWWEDNPEYVDDYFEYGDNPQPGSPQYEKKLFFDRSEFDVDVAFIGDSIAEQRVGKVMGKEQPTLKANAKTFQKTYSKASGGKFDGVSLGVSGDTSPVLLWRLLHGEMPSDFNPRVWWLTIGTNDLLRTQCSEEVTLMGILRVVEEILLEKQDATVVINSILPLSLDPSGLLQSSKRKPKVGKGGPPFNLWPSIQLLNEQLKKFAAGHKRVKFFDATDIFISREGSDVVLDQTLYLDGINPNAAGYKAWDEHIVKRLDAIVQKKEQKEYEEKQKEVHDTSKDEDEIEKEVKDKYWYEGSEGEDDMAFLYDADFEDDVWIGQGGGE